MDYDEFKVGDKVWCETLGFGLFEHENDTACFGWMGDEILVTPDGCNQNFPELGRKFFHAVTDTHEGMRFAVQLGGGLKRRVDRGRWPIYPGDRVVLFSLEGRVITSGLAESPSNVHSYELQTNDYSFNSDGTYIRARSFPQAMRLYDGEEVFDDNIRNAHWILDEAIKFGWNEKYGTK